jgi:hypothetical protein
LTLSIGSCRPRQYAYRYECFFHIILFRIFVES